MSAVKPAWFFLFFALHCSVFHAFPSLHDQDHDSAIVPVMDTQGMQWKNDLHYLTYLCMDDLGQLCFRTYPFTAISMPGIYKLADNVTNEITISASNVTLDLNGCTVSGGANGIVINSGLSHVTIKNGKIDTVSSDGIQVNAGCSDIQISDVEVKNALRAIDCEQVANSVIKNCELNLSTTGLELDGCYNVTVRNCTARANTHAGYDLLTSTTCSLLECQAFSTGDGNSDIQSEVFGFIAKDGNGNLFERCTANATQALSLSDSDSVLAGIALRGAEQCSRIIDCECSNGQTNENGFTIPYGILLEGSIDSIESVTGSISSVAQLRTVEWSPDGRFVATGGRFIPDGNQLQVFSFDRISQTLTSITGALTGLVIDIDWSQDGQYLAISGAGLGGGNELQVFKFDENAGTLTNIASALGASGDLLTVSWSLDMQYIVTGGFGTSGDELKVLRFDPVDETLTFITEDLPGNFVVAVDWSLDGQYIAVGGDGVSGGNELQVLRFDRPSGTLTTVDGALGTGGAVRAVHWSPDGKYIVAGGNSLSGNELQVFRFDRSTETLTSVAGALTGTVFAAHWSSDGKYIAVGGDVLGNEAQVLRFNADAGTLTVVAGTLGSGGNVRKIKWAPDGTYIAVAGDGITGGSGDEFQILTGLVFPENNIVKGNTVYCNSGGQLPSGIGISAPSITNQVIQNTAFNNPIPRAVNEPIVSTNYAFVTNVFNQLFGDAPTLLQNITLSSIDPILNRYDIPTKLLRLEALAESLIDSLL